MKKHTTITQERQSLREMPTYHQARRMWFNFGVALGIAVLDAVKGVLCWCQARGVGIVSRMAARFRGR